MSISAAILQEKRLSLESEIGDIRIKLDELQSQRRQLQAKLELLDELDELDVGEEDEDGEDELESDDWPVQGERLSTSSSRLPGQGRKPRNAIIELLTASPGLSLSEIVDTLEERVQSSAADVRGNLRTTVYQLAAKGMITKKGEDAYYVAAA